MTSISIDQATKDRWDELKPEDDTHDEFCQEVLDAYEYSDDPVKIDIDEIVDEITHRVAGECELSAYRGVTDALESSQ